MPNQHHQWTTRLWNPYLETLGGPTGVWDPAVPAEVVSAREWVVTACADGSAAMWDANTGEWCKSLFGHDLQAGWRVHAYVFFGGLVSSFDEHLMPIEKLLINHRFFGGIVIFIHFHQLFGQTKTKVDGGWGGWSKKKTDWNRRVMMPSIDNHGLMENPWHFVYTSSTRYIMLSLCTCCSFLGWVELNHIHEQCLETPDLGNKTTYVQGDSSIWYNNHTWYK